MIIVKLIGGLGNQMFQYAMGRSLAYRNNTDLKIDISGYHANENITKREFGLSVFNIKADFSRLEDIEKIKINKTTCFLQRIFNKAGFKKIICNHVRERFPYNFDRQIYNLRDGIYLDGYWQSEEYFIIIDNIIKKEFTLNCGISKSSKYLLNIINKTNSVSIHVRRGDYVKNKLVNMYHGSCDMNYYNLSVDILKNKIKDPVFFIFSDDIDWCRDNFKIKNKKFFISGLKDYEDLILMSECKHNIISNSSFSWWSAWLNKNKDKIVIAPRKWMNIKNDRINIVPKHWLKI